jgi:hypothetical protein
LIVGDFFLFYRPLGLEKAFCLRVECGVKWAASGDDLMIQTLLVWSFGELMRNILGTDDNGNKIGDELKAIARVSSN